MESTTTERTAERQITDLLAQWAEAVRHNDKASIWRNHDPRARIFDALPPIEYADLQAYRDNWDSWQPPFAEPPRFEFSGLQVCAGPEVAFAHGLLRCTGSLEDGTELNDQVRATFGFVRRDGRWLFTHQHISLPLCRGDDDKHLTSEERMHFSPYLNFDGHCKEAFEFYAEVLGGEITFMSTFAEAPDDEGISPGLKDKIMHAQLKVGDQVIMASDASPQNYDIPRGIHITIGVDTPEEAERIYEALSEGGSVQMPLDENFWAKRFGMFSDRFGIPWMVNCDK